MSEDIDDESSLACGGVAIGATIASCLPASVRNRRASTQGLEDARRCRNGRDH
jgi:hypothetical protein